MDHDHDGDKELTFPTSYHNPHLDLHLNKAGVSLKTK